MPGAAALVLADRPADAEALARYVVGIQTDIGLADPVLLATARRIWGQALSALGRFDEAEVPLLEAHEIEADALGEDHMRTQSTVDALVELYGRWGDEAQRTVWEGRRTPSS